MFFNRNPSKVIHFEIRNTLKNLRNWKWLHTYVLWRQATISSKRLWGKRNSGSKIRWWNKNRNIEIISKSLPFNQFNPKSKRHRIDRNLGKFQILASFVLIWFGRSQLFNFESRNLFKAENSIVQITTYTCPV